VGVDMGKVNVLWQDQIAKASLTFIHGQITRGEMEQTLYGYGVDDIQEQMKKILDEREIFQQQEEGFMDADIDNRDPAIYENGE
jgi:hypothetical protein